MSAEEAKEQTAEETGKAAEAESKNDTPSLVGTWVLTKNENLDAFLRINGVNFMIRKMAGKGTPTMKIEQEGDNFVITTSTFIMTQIQKFTIGQESESEFHGGNMTKLKARWEDKKLVVDIEPLGDSKVPKQVTTRELLSDDEMLLTMDNGEVCKRWFKRQG